MTSTSKELQYSDILGRKIEKGSIVVIGNSYGASLSLVVVVGFTPHGLRCVTLTRTRRWYYARSWEEEPTSYAVDKYQDPDNPRDKIEWTNEYGMDRWDQPVEHFTMKNRILVQPEQMLTPKLKRQYQLILDYFCIEKPEFRSRWESQLELV